MVDTLLRFVYNNLPAEWEDVPVERYRNTYLLFPMPTDSPEYQELQLMFRGTNFRVSSIQRVQNPYQYGRFLLRKFLVDEGEEIVFHPVRKVDLSTALQGTCDFRRYARPYFDDIRHYTKHPCFYNTFHILLQKISILEVVSPNELCVLVLNKLKTLNMSQCDYFIKYVVEFNGI